MKKALFGFSILLILFLLWFNWSARSIQTEPTPIPVKTSLDSDLLFQLVNNWRVQNGYRAYIQDQRLCKIAIDRADDGLDYHKGFYEKYSNYPYIIQENDFYYFPSEISGFDGWLNSPPHLATLEKSYKYSCVACHNLDCAEIFSNFYTGSSNIAPATQTIICPPGFAPGTTTCLSR